MKKMIVVFSSLLIISFFVFGMVGLSNAAPITLKLAHVVSTSAPYHIGAMEFSRLVDLKTKGQIKIEIYPGGQLGKGERECIEGLQIGTIDLVVTSTGPVGGFVP
ncbi:MAG: C4-dicarboxylate ABC transporter substrate-binding protein, partial [Thermodesulfobacteriota bacterium]